MVQQRNRERPWERQPGEGDAAWAAFEVYRGLGSQRSLKRVSAQHGRALSGLTKHSSRWQWVSRAAAWDAEVVRRGDEAALGEVEQLRRKQARHLGVIEAAAFATLESAFEAGGLSCSLAARLFLETVKLQRLVVGEATEAVAVESKRDLSKVLSGEQLEQLVAMKVLLDGEE